MILLLAACGTKDPHDHDHDHDHELITSVVLDMTDQDGNEYSFAWDETTGDDLPDVEIPANSSLTVAVSFLNTEEDPPEDITLEIEDEADEHQVFWMSDLATYTYDDADADGLPLGLWGTIDTTDAGEGELEVTLRHLPLQDGESQKFEGMEDVVESEGFASIGGDNDVQLAFPLVVF